MISVLLNREISCYKVIYQEFVVYVLLIYVQCSLVWSCCMFFFEFFVKYFPYSVRYVSANSEDRRLNKIAISITTLWLSICLVMLGALSFFLYFTLCWNQCQIYQELSNPHIILIIVQVIEEIDFNSIIYNEFIVSCAVMLSVRWFVVFCKISWRSCQSYLKFWDPQTYFNACAGNLGLSMQKRYPQRNCCFCSAELWFAFCVLLNITSFVEIVNKPILNHPVLFISSIHVLSIRETEYNTSFEKNFVFLRYWSMLIVLWFVLWRRLSWFTYQIYLDSCNHYIRFETYADN